MMMAMMEVTMRMKAMVMMKRLMTMTTMMMMSADLPGKGIQRAPEMIMGDLNQASLMVMLTLMMILTIIIVIIIIIIMVRT